tara:strand:- start:121 stop:675 length:555 start_codon:yes stop_codon:yes gene_type:complete
MLEKRVEKIKKNKASELLWILEHPLTYTGGVRFNKNDILDKNIKVIRTNRGGRITLHNPGQKIIYIALNLNKRKRDIRNLVNVMEDCIIKFLRIYKIKGVKDKKNIGIWVNKNKIAAIGIRVSKWVAYHGCSINIKNNLNDYLKIVPCGLNNKNITSVFNENKLKIKNINNNIKKIFFEKLNKI